MKSLLLSKMLFEIFKHPFFLFFFTFLFYLVTLFPSIHFGDNPELVGASFSLGTAHPSGYPIYLLISKLFSFIPIGSLAFRANLLSALLGSFSLVILFLFLKRLSVDEKISFLSVMLFAFSSSLWSQSIMGEVYTLNNLFIAGILYCVMKYSKPSWRGSSTLTGINTPVMLKTKLSSGAKRFTQNPCFHGKNDQKPYLLLASFLFGIGMTNHITLVLIVPAIVFLFWYEGKTQEVIKQIIPCGFLFLIGYSVYLYLLIRAGSNSPARWMMADNLTFTDFVKFIFIARDQKVIYSQLTNQSFIFTIKNYFDIFTNYLNQWKIEFPALFLLFIPPGIFNLWRKDKKIFLFCWFFVLPFTALFILFCDPSREEALGVFVIPSFLIVAIWISYGIMGVISVFQKEGKYSWITPALMVLVIFFQIRKQFDKNDFSDNYLAYDYGVNILNTLENKSQLNYSLGTQNMYLLFYLNEFVENYRPDIQYGPAVASDPNADNFLYFKDPNYDLGQYNLFPAGLLYHLVKKDKPRDLHQYWDYYFLEDLEKEEMYKDIQSRKIRADYYFFQAQYYEMIGDVEKGENLYNKAILYNPKIFYEKGKKLLRNNKKDEAKKIFQKVLKFYPNHNEINYNMGMMAFLDGDNIGAIKYLERIKKIDPVSAEALYVLGHLYYDQKKFKKAKAYLKRFLFYRPNDSKRVEVKKWIKVIDSM